MKNFKLMLLSGEFILVMPLMDIEIKNKMKCFKIFTFIEIAPLILQ